MLNQEDIKLIEQTRLEIEDYIYKGLLNKLTEEKDNLKIFQILKVQFPIDKLTCLILVIYKRILWEQEQVDLTAFLNKMYKLQDDLKDSTDPDAVKAYNDLLSKWWNQDIAEIIDNMKRNWFNENIDAMGNGRADRFALSLYMILNETLVLYPEQITKYYNSFLGQDLSQECAFIYAIISQSVSNLKENKEEYINQILNEYKTYCKDISCETPIKISLPSESSGSTNEKTDWLIPSIIIGGSVLLGILFYIFFLNKKKKKRR